MQIKSKKMKIANRNNWTWKSFLSNCAEAWKTEGVGGSYWSQECHKALCAVAPTMPTSATKIQIAAAAWKYYQENMKA